MEKTTNGTQAGRRLVSPNSNVKKDVDPTDEH